MTPEASLKLKKVQCDASRHTAGNSSYFLSKKSSLVKKKFQVKKTRTAEMKITALKTFLPNKV